VFESIEAMLVEYAELEKQLADPGVHGDQAVARKLGKRYAELGPIVEAYKSYQANAGNIETAKELAQIDPEFAAELETLQAERTEIELKLQHLLIPRDPMDDKDCILEVKAGEGGQESMLFAGDLLRMYLRFAERQNWKTEIIEATDSDLGGYKDVSLAIKFRGGNPQPGEGIWARLKYEGGVHRVQRVPVTESQGRIHTSAAGVLVLPEAEDVEVEINANDLRIDVFRSSGPGGQSVNTTDSAVRITHLPTGVVVSCQNEKSQLQNKESAMRILRARLLAFAQEEADKEASDVRRSQIRTMDRSERIRTYNYPENRLSDHRTGFKSYNLDQVLDGDLEAVIQSCVDADLAAKLSGPQA
jgi:peptide chain release factor 1